MRRSSLFLRVVALALFALGAGCATPHYQTRTRLIPPADAAGRACIQDCEAKKTAFQTDCQARYQTCSKALEPQVEVRFTEALRKYETDLRQYAAILRNYELQLRYEWPHYDPYSYPYWRGAWPGPHRSPPFPVPVMPTREGIRAQLEKQNCQSDCSSLPAYDACFVGCGGQLLTDTVCIKNCPPAR